MTLATLELSDRRLVIQEGTHEPMESLEFSAKLSDAGHIKLGLPKGFSRTGSLSITARTDSKKKSKSKKKPNAGKLRWNGDWMRLELALHSTFSAFLSLSPEHFNLLIQESRNSSLEVWLEIHSLESIAVYESDSERGSVEWDVDHQPELPIDGFSFHCRQQIISAPRKTKRRSNSAI